MYYPSTQSTPVALTTETVVYISQWNELNLFLPTDSLSMYQNYTFSVNIITSANSNYKSSITLYSSIIPILGQLILSSSTAQPINNEITLYARDFIGSSLTYEFYYTRDDTIKIPIQTRSVIATAKFIPPLITTTQPVSITIHVTVYNAQDRAITASKPFTIAIFNGDAAANIISLLSTTKTLVSNKEFNKAFARLSTLIISEFHNTVTFPANSTNTIFAMVNDLSRIPIIPAYSGTYIDLIRYLRIDQLANDKSNEYLQFILRLSKAMSSTLNTIKLTPIQSFPSPTIFPFDEPTVFLLLELIMKIPVTPNLESNVLFSIFDEISKILCLTTFFGSQPVTMANSQFNLYFSNGYMYSENNFCIGNDCQINSIQFPSQITQQFHDWDCNINSMYNCNGLCISFYFVRLMEISGNSTVKLSQTAQNTINASNLTITGFYFNFKDTSLITEILLLQLNNPISASKIELTDNEININFVVAQGQSNGNGLILCLYGLSQSSEWEIESFISLQTLITNNINCQYTHNTQYALARLNYLPIITQPTTPAPTISTNFTTRATIPTTQVPIKSEFPVGVAILPILLLFVILG